MGKIKKKKRSPLSPIKIPPHVRNIDNTPLTPEEIKNLEAVKRELFTAHEMVGTIECYHDDLRLLFSNLDRYANDYEKTIEELHRSIIHYQLRFDSNPQKFFYWHQHIKLMKFLNAKLWEAQRDFHLDYVTPSKTAKANKDLLLNEEQLIIFFKYVQKIKILSPDLKDTKFSSGLNILTGWDKEKLRKLLSENNKGVNVTHKAIVLKATKKLLSELEKPD